MKHRASRSRRGRPGSSLVELVVAIVILGVASMGLAGMALHAGRTATGTAGTAQRDNALANLSELAVATPFADLTRLAGCTDGGAEGAWYQYCIRVLDENVDLREVTIVIEPEDNAILPDSAVLLRARGTASTPF